MSGVINHKPASLLTKAAAMVERASHPTLTESNVRAPWGRVIIVLGLQTWGAGATEKGALANWRKAVPTFHRRGTLVRVSVVEADDQACVSDVDGAIETPKGKDRAKLLHYREVRV